MKKRVRAHTLQISKKCRLGVNDTYAFLPTEFTQSDNGKSLVYDHSTKTVVLEEGVGIDDGKTSSNSTWSSTKISTELGTKQPTITGSTNLTVNNLNANTSVNSTFINAHQFEVVNPNPGQLGYKLPTSIPAETKFLKSDAVSGQAYWGDAPTVPTIGATNLASNWNWDYNQNFILATPVFTSVLPVSISPTNNINNGYIIDNVNNIYKTQPGSWGNHKYSINVNIEPVDSHDYPLKVYAIYFKSNGLGWNAIKSVMSLFDMNILASAGHPGLGLAMLSEITDRPHNGFLSMYGAGSFSIPEESKNTYTGFVQSYISSILHVGGQIIPYGFTASGITFSPSIDPTFGSFNQLYSFDITTWFFYNGTTSPTYAQVNQYGARAGSWIILQSTSISGPPFTTVQTCLLVQSVNVTTGAVTFVNNSNLQDFVNSTGLLTNKTVLYVLNNWDQPIVANSNGYTIKATGLKTEIYQISPKGEAGENGVPGDPTLLLDDVNIDTQKTFSSSKINSTYQPLITGSTNLTTASLSTGVLTSPGTTTAMTVSKGLTLNSTVTAQSTVSCSTLKSTDPSNNLTVNSHLSLGTYNVFCKDIQMTGNASTTNLVSQMTSAITPFSGTPSNLYSNRLLFNQNQTANNLAWSVAGSLDSGKYSGLSYSAFSGPFHLVSNVDQAMLTTNNGVHLPWFAPGAGFRAGAITCTGIDVRSAADSVNTAGNSMISISNAGFIRIPSGSISVGDHTGALNGVRMFSDGKFYATNTASYNGDIVMAGGSGTQKLLIHTTEDATAIRTGAIQTRGGLYVEKTIFINNNTAIRNESGDIIVPVASVARQTGTLTMYWFNGTGQVPGVSSTPSYRAHVYNKTVILHVDGWIYNTGGNADSTIFSSALPVGLRPAQDTEFPIRCRYNFTNYSTGYMVIRTDGLLSFYPTTTENSLWPASATNCTVNGGNSQTYTYRIA